MPVTTHDELATLHRNAACRNAEPYIFDATDMLTAAPGLAYCAQCPVIRLCEKVLKPGIVGYDGIAAASVWRAGRRIGHIGGPYPGGKRK